MIAPGHPRYEEFLDRLEGPEGCDFKEGPKGTQWSCGGGNDKSKAEAILKAMGEDEESIKASLSYFEAHGGYCDCEILFNVS